MGTDGSSRGDMGMGDCRASPKVLPVMPSRISPPFFSKKLKLICQPQQTLSISTATTTPPPLTVGAFPFVHRGMEIFKSLH